VKVKDYTGRKKERERMKKIKRKQDSNNCQYWEVLCGQLYAPAALSRGKSPRRY
jgi:hypothetical protein